MSNIKDYYDEVDKRTWKCSICLQNVRAAFTSNLLQHFKRHHPEAYAEYIHVNGKKPREATNCEQHETISEETAVDFEWAQTEEDDNIIQEAVYTPEPSAKRPRPQTTTPSSTSDDPLKLFFETMYATVRRMPREDMMSLRRRIFDMVCEVEEQHHYSRQVQEHEDPK